MSAGCDNSEVLYGSSGCGELKKIKISNLPEQGDRVRLVCVSDTHESEQVLNLPKGDILIHCGDILLLSPKQSEKVAIERFKKFIKWFGNQNQKHKIMICGNHDNRIAEMGQDMIRDLCSQTGRHINYLQHDSLSLMGINFFGIPNSYGRSSNNCFQTKSLIDYSSIPTETDIVISHGPCLGISPNCNTFFVKEFHNGLKHTNTDLILAGHLHWSEGLSFLKNNENRPPIASISCSLLNQRYEPSKQPIVFDYVCKTDIPKHIHQDPTPVVVVYGREQCFTDEIRRDLIENLRKYYIVTTSVNSIDLSLFEQTNTPIGFIALNDCDDVVTLIKRISKKVLTALCCNDSAMEGGDRFHDEGYNIVTGSEGCMDIVRIMCLSESVMMNEIPIISYSRLTTVRHHVINSRVKRLVVLVYDKDDSTLQFTVDLLIRKLRQAWVVSVKCSEVDASLFIRQSGIVDVCVVLSPLFTSLLSSLPDCCKRISFGFKKLKSTKEDITHITPRKSINELLQVMDEREGGWSDHVALKKVENPLDFSTFNQTVGID